MDFKKLCENILENVGGRSNILVVEHCMTRLRITVKDKSIVMYDNIDKLEGVIGYVDKGSQIQIIIGNDINIVFDEFNNLIGDLDTNKNNNEIKGEERLLNRVLNAISEIFNPIVPALAGAGIIKAFLVILKLTNVLQDDSQTYFVLNTISDSVFTFLPILLAYSSAKKFKASPYLSVALAATMLHPNFSSLISEGTNQISFIGLPLNLLNYSSSVVPIIFGVLFLSYVEKFMNKIVPSVLKIVFVPALTMLVAIPIVLLTIGPLAQLIGNGLATVITLLFDKGGWVAGLVYGGIYSAMVVTGLQHGMVPVLVQSIATNGYNNISPASGAANMGQAGAAFAVWLKSKQQSTKTVAAGASISALLGVTEPAIYGVNLRLKKPFIGAAIGGAVGGAIAVGFGGRAYAMGGPSFATIPMFIGDDGGKWLYVLLGFVVSFIVSAIVAYVIGFEEDSDVQETDNIIVNKNDISELPIDVYSPVPGEIINLEDVPDKTFSSGILGYGFAINPIEDKISSPIDGEIVSVFKTGHAFGIKGDNGVEILVHIGIDTVELGGDIFNCQVKEGDMVNAGDILTYANISEIIKHNYSPLVLVLVTNKQDFPVFNIEDLESIGYSEKMMRVGI